MGEEAKIPVVSETQNRCLETRQGPRQLKLNAFLQDKTKSKK